jgi:hypothetical protein
MLRAANGGCPDVIIPRTPSRQGRALAGIVALGALVLAVSATPGLAAGACAKQVITDWYDNGRVDHLYDLHCYRDAIKSLPPDVRDYSSAREDIQRALQFAQRGQSDPGENGGSTTGGATPPVTTPPAGGGESPPATSTQPPATTTSPPTSAPPEPTTSAPPATAKPSAPTAQPEDGGTEAMQPLEASDPSSVPVPLLVLGGLALLLLAAGSAGYLVRRFGGRGGDGGEPPPAV